MSEPIDTNVPAEPKLCPHDTIAEAGGIRVCLDCGEPNAKRRKAKR